MPKERLQKFLSNAGIASRRRAEALIEKGLVLVNGRAAKIGDSVDPGKDKISFQGKPVSAETRSIYIALNKPRGYISSRFDPQKRKSVYDLLPKDLRAKVWSVGRLDYYSEGLMVFTNDGGLTQALAHPKYEHEKEYEVQLNKQIGDADLNRLRRGVEIGQGAVTAPAKIKVRGGRILMAIREGKKRQIRRMFESLGFKVKVLKRIRINKLSLGDLAPGKHKFITKEEII